MTRRFAAVVLASLLAVPCVAALKPGTSSAFNVQRGDKLVELSINPGVRPRPQQRNVRR